MKRKLLVIGFLFTSVLAYSAGAPVEMKALSEMKPVDQDYYYVWQINLDDKPGDEFVVASGYSDGIDYSIYRDFRNEKSLVCRFSPVLIDPSKESQPFYWGYPWDIKNIVTRKDGGRTKIRCSFDHKITREGAEIDVPKWQNQVAAIFFTGKSTQPDISVGPIKKIDWLTLEEIEKKVRAKK